VAQAAKHLVMAAAPDCRNEFAIVACENERKFRHRDRIRGLSGSPAGLGRVRGNVDGDVQPADGLPELDLSEIAANSVSKVVVPALNSLA
jgi:hypothetical protein